MKDKLNDIKKALDSTILKIPNLYISTFTTQNCKDERKFLKHYASELITQRKNIILISSNLDLLCNDECSLALTKYTLVNICEYIEIIFNEIKSVETMLKCKIDGISYYSKGQDEELEDIYITVITSMVDSTKECIKSEKQKVNHRKKEIK